MIDLLTQANIEKFGVLLASLMATLTVAGC